MAFAIMWHASRQPKKGKGNRNSHPDEIEKYLHLIFIVTEVGNKERTAYNALEKANAAFLAR
jgi:hypothetical protein